MMNLWEKAKGSVAASDTPQENLIIGAHESICAFRLPAILQEYKQRYPEVSLVIKTGSWCELGSLLRENQIDVAIPIEHKVANPEFMVAMQRNEPLALLVSPEHPLARKDKVFAGDIVKYPLLMTGESCSWRALFYRAVNNADNIHVMSEGGSIQTLKQLAGCGLGVTLLPLFTVTAELETNRLIEVNWRGMDLQLMAQVVYHKDKWISAALAAFLAMCQERL